MAHRLRATSVQIHPRVSAARKILRERGIAVAGSTPRTLLFRLDVACLRCGRKVETWERHPWKAFNRFRETVGAACGGNVSDGRGAPA